MAEVSLEELILEMAANDKHKTEWILCPVCHCRTRTKVREDTTLLNFPLFCPKCKREFLINVVNSKISLTKE